MQRSALPSSSVPGWPNIHLKNASIVDAVTVPIYDAPEQRFCPAGMPPADIQIEFSECNVLRSWQLP
jgi:hypothetical protein